MADQRSSYQLSSPLCAVLSSLNVNLEAELSRYRRNRLASPSSREPLTELEEAAFDLTTVDSTIDDIAASIAPAASVTPPPLPRNKKLFPDALAVAAIAPALGASTGSSTNGYLASSEKLIESLSEAPPEPEPVTTTSQQQRRTVSLVAGAALGLLGLAAGLGASYLLSNPQVAQRLANRPGGDRTALATADGETFTPPGPDLSAQEFVNLELDNLSSLKMPQAPLDPQPASTPQAASPPTQPLPPIANESGSPLQSETQAVAIPAGSSYYVTVPFTTEQGLLDIRKSVDEAFVRQFADGTRVQLAAFDNPESAQQFIAEIKAQGITAQVYGPTSE
ncbi:MAG: SPOR domain-containing protein [Phormidesmis sp.]